MSFFRSKILDSSPLTGADQYTPFIDCTNLSQGTFSITVSGVAGTPSIVCSLQGNSDVPPNGIIPGQPATNAFTSPWVPASSQWVALNQADSSTPLTATATSNSTFNITATLQELNCRFVRVKLAAPTTGTGGTISVNAFLRSDI